MECGVCFSDCTAVQATPEFIGPTALVKAHRYATDPRDNDSHHRLAELSDQHGLWECMRCYFCSERCPKHIRVRDLIAQLGEMACDEALRTDPGARHAEAFITSLREGGRLNEAKLPVQSQGWVWTLQRLPMVVRIALAGKLQLAAVAPGSTITTRCCASWARARTSDEAELRVLPGCVPKQSTRELDAAARLVCSRLGIELEEMTGAPCCGAGDVHEIDAPS